MANRFSKKENSNPNAEMTFIDHLEALRWHIIRSLLAVVILAILVFCFHGWIFAYIIEGPINSNFITYRLFCKLGQILHTSTLCMNPVRVSMQTTTYTGQFLGAFTMAFLGGFLVASPYIFWEFWRFAKPALKNKELKNSRFAIFWVSFFFLLGATFGYFVLGPFTFSFLANFQISDLAGSIETRPTLNDYLKNLTNIVVFCGIAFELPVAAYVLTRIGIITPKFLTGKRKYAIVILLIVAAFITPSPDWISQMIVFAPLMILYEIGVAVSKKVAKEKAEKERREQQEWS